MIDTNAFPLKWCAFALLSINFRLDSDYQKNIKFIFTQFISIYLMSSVFGSLTLQKAYNILELLNSSYSCSRPPSPLSRF